MNSINAASLQQWRRLAGVPGRTPSRRLVMWLVVSLFIAVTAESDGSGTADSNTSGPAAAQQRIFPGKGVVKEIDPGGKMVVIRHEAIAGYMAAMTMPFEARPADGLKGLRPGDEITFELHVTATDSWVDHLVRVGSVPVAAAKSSGPAEAGAAPARRGRNPLLYFKFTNELGQKVSLSDFQGQALAITFFFTRCPIPNFCPRLSKNFEEASQALLAMPDAPTNWHFLSVSFDPDFDTPPVLKTYARRYHYNPAHWSFLTGPKDKIVELARLSGVEVDSDAGLFNHNFRTLIIDATGRLQTTFPFGGNLSDAIVSEILKGAAAGRSLPVGRPGHPREPAAPGLAAASGH